MAARGKREELVSVREAAMMCNRNMETVRRWIWGGKLPAQKLGNQLFINKDDLAGYCRETTVKPYQAEKKVDFLEEAIAFRNKLKARGFKPVNAGELIREMREERARELYQRMR